MRLMERLDGLSKWTYETVCKGKQFKTPAGGMNMHDISYQEPKVFVGYYPTRPDTTQYSKQPTVLNTAPSILLMPSVDYAKNNEQERFDRYSHIQRPKKLGHIMKVQVLFSIFEDGIRLPDYDYTLGDDDGPDIDMTRIVEGTHDGVGLLFNWMEEFSEALLGVNMVPGTDLTVIDDSIRYGPVSDQKYINDKRPLYYGLLEVSFQAISVENARERKAIYDIIN